MKKKEPSIHILHSIVGKLKFFDYVTVVFAVLLVVVSSLYVYGSNRGVLYVHIKSFSREWILPLDGGERIIHVEGPLGVTEVEIDKSTVRIVKSPCKNKICVRSGAISRPGQWVACLPNRVIVSIEGRGPKEDYVDAVNF